MSPRPSPPRLPDVRAAYGRLRARLQDDPELWEPLDVLIRWTVVLFELHEYGDDRLDAVGEMLDQGFDTDEAIRQALR
jgi:hypothetical protein